MAETYADAAAYDAATATILAGLDRTPGLQRAVLAELDPAQQLAAFAADDRHRGRARQLVLGGEA